MGGQLDGEAGRAQAPDHRVVVPEGRGTGFGPRLHEADRPGVAQQRIAGRDRALTHGRLPVSSVGRQSDFAENEIDEAIEEVILVGDVIVQRHRLDLELLADLAHAE